MNPALLVKLRASSPWRIGPDSGARNRVEAIYHSDALYSAVTHAMSRLGFLDLWLGATARAAEPAVCFSSCFPLSGDTLFVTPPRTVWPPNAASLASGRVRWKSARFVPLEIVHDILGGKSLNEDRWTLDGASGCLVRTGRQGPFLTSLRWSAAIDRLSGAAERHAAACLEFRPGAGVWAVASFTSASARDVWQPRVEAAFRWLADSGFGGERSRGWGRAESPEFKAGELPGLLLPAMPSKSAPAPSASGPDVTPPVQEPPQEQPPVQEPPPDPELPKPDPEPVPEPGPAPGPGPEPGPEPGPDIPQQEPEPAFAEAQGAAPSAVEPLEPPTAGLSARDSEAIPDPGPAPGPGPEPGPQDPQPESEPAFAAAQVAAPTAIAPLEAQPTPTPEPISSVPEQLASELATERPAPEPASEQSASEPAAERPSSAPVAERPQRPAAHWLLSLFTPAPTDAVDWSRGNYQLIDRAGRVESSAGAGALKKQIRMIAEGSVLYSASSLRGAAPNVAPDGFAHPVFRAGFAVAVPLPEAS